jgi:LCP family protein required for cell wall assembly
MLSEYALMNNNLSPYRANDDRDGSGRRMPERYRRHSRSDTSTRPATKTRRQAGSRHNQPSPQSTRSSRAGKTASRRRGRTVTKRILIILVSLLAIAAIAFGIYLYVLNGNLSSGLDPKLFGTLTEKNLTKEPSYMVLLGTDQSIDRETDSTTSGTYRTDSIMLARIDPVEKKVTLVSIPRDTLVDLEGYGEHKINAAYAYGGSSLAVSSISELAGVDISHFALIDMDGLTEIVDALGGIDVNVPVEIDDDEAGGHLDAGEQTLNGEQALILARSRHTYDSYGIGDEYRSANQRLVLSAIADKVLSSDLATIASTATTLSDYVQTDLSVSEIVSLAQALQGIDADADIYSATMPTTSAYENGVSVQRLDEDDWNTMKTRIEQGLSPTESSIVDSKTGVVLASAGDATSTDDKSGTIVVKNGSGYSGLANEVASTLSDAGYYVSETGNADSFDYRKTLVVYSNQQNATKATNIATTIGHGATAVLNDGTYKLSGDFLVIVGSNYPSTTT